MSSSYSESKTTPTSSKNNNKTYVWVRLRGDDGSNTLLSCSASTPSAANNTKGQRRVAKKRGAPITARAGSRGGSDNQGREEEKEIWGWTPGYFCTKVSENGRGGEEGGADADSFCLFTLLPLHHPYHSSSSCCCSPADDTNNSNNNGDFRRTEYTLTEAQTKELLSSGYVVLANQWEQYDFVNRLQLGSETRNGNDDDESDYNYDECDDDSNNDDDSNDEESSGNRQKIMSNLFDVAQEEEDAPPHNLIDLTHLHECSVVHALQYRYYQNRNILDNGGCAVTSDMIYTDTGPILLAVNPFKNDESGMLYGDVTVQRYREEGERRWLSERSASAPAGAVKNASDACESSSSTSTTTLSPHVFAVADRTFRTMMTRLHPPDVDIIISSTSNNSSNKNVTATFSTASSSTLNQQSQQDRSGSPFNVNQSILVSGESGAGKTVTTKLLMGYLAKLSEQPPLGGGCDDISSITTAAGIGVVDAEEDETTTSKTSAVHGSDNNSMSVERRVLESNPIMESFGNARTVRNDNSSRFGKYIEMKFVSTASSYTNQHNSNSKVAVRATLVGASIETYLLEKVRLVHQSQGERNYHIFYELFSMKYNDDDDDDDDAGGEEENTSLLEQFGLVNYDMQDFSLINSSDTYDRRDGVSDRDTFRAMKKAMEIMGLPTAEQHSVFAVCCAFLHMSNLTFVEVGEVECALEMENPHLDFVVDLLGITRDGLNRALCYYEITVGGHGRKVGETHRRELSRDQAKKGVEALIKATYGAMFNYLVERINASVAVDGNRNVTRPKSSKCEKDSTIGILDIFGFESFQVNSFEQLCINYCNEALQQQFNRFVLRNEQEEYDKEGIPWSFIEFPENQDVLDLIDQKGSGILNMLHDQCRTPGASDKTFALSLYNACTNHSRFEADSRQVAEQLFAVHHYAGLVEYHVEGFVEKNRDELPKEASDLLISSSNEFVRTLAEILQPSLSAGRNKITSPRSGAAQRPTVGVQFSSQLHSLRSKIDETSPHYIRCLKPNNLLAPEMFDAALIADQLRCAGVIEAVRVSRLGYPQRYSHKLFISRYRILGMKALKKKNNSPKTFNPTKALVRSIKGFLNADKKQNDIGIQVGKSKVFLKRDAYDKLEKLRRDKIESSVVVIQKNARGYVYLKHYSKALRAVLCIQCFMRCVQAMNAVNRLRRQDRSIIIQSCWRRYSSKKLLLSAKTIALWCQSHLRGSLGRKEYNVLNQDKQALYLQSIWRRYVAVRDLKRYRCAAVIIQCAMRSHHSRVKLNTLKANSRDLFAVLQERDMLRQEIIELKKMTPERNMVQVSMSLGDASEIAFLRSALDHMSLEKERIERELDQALQVLETVKDQKDTYLEVSKALQAEMNSLDEKHRAEMKRLSTDLSRVRCENQQLRERKEDRQLLVVGAVDADSQFQPVGNVSDPTSNDLQQALAEIERLTCINVNLQQVNYDLSEKHASNVKVSRREPALVANTSVCTSVTADITDTDEEISKLKEENQILRKQLVLLRTIGPDDVIPGDQEYDESVAPDEEGSTVSSHKGDALAVFATASTDRDERRLKNHLNELKEELKQTKKRAKYDLDNAQRVNTILQRDLEKALHASKALNDELDQRYEDFQTLQEDMEKFAETFATQHEELQHLQGRVRKLLSENEEKSNKIVNLEAQLELLKIEKKAPEWVGDEIDKLWNEISRMKKEETKSASDC